MVDDVQISNSALKLSDYSKNLDVFLDSELSLQKHLANIVSSGYFKLKSLL